jgi:hypothetical protein
MVGVPAQLQPQVAFPGFWHPMHAFHRCDFKLLVVVPFVVVPFLLVAAAAAAAALSIVAGPTPTAASLASTAALAFFAQTDDLTVGQFTVLADHVGCAMGRPIVQSTVAQLNSFVHRQHPVDEDKSGTSQGQRTSQGRVRDKVHEKVSMKRCS